MAAVISSDLVFLKTPSPHFLGYNENMIIGVGIDVVNIPRFIYYATTIPHFLVRLFSPQELRLSNLQLAGNFAASEAFVKACPNKFLDLVSKVEFLRSPNGKPTVVLYDSGKMPISIFNVHVSLTNLDNLVIAAIVIEQKDGVKEV